MIARQATADMLAEAVWDRGIVGIEMGLRKMIEAASGVLRRDGVKARPL